MQHCQNCDKSLSSEKYDLHLGYCRRNIKRCAECNLPFDINNIEQHKEEFHKFQKCIHCQASINANEKQKHDKICKAKPITCYVCELSVPVQKFESHRVQCQSRTSKCSTCNKIIKNKDIMSHQKNCQGPIEKQSTQMKAQINRHPIQKFNDDSRKEQKKYIQKSYLYGQQVENYGNAFQTEDHELQAALLASLGFNLPLSLNCQ